MAYPKKIGLYCIKSVLGEGGYGQVFLGKHKNTGATYAIKLSSESIVLLKEFEIMKQLSALKNFIKVHECGHLGEDAYIVMDVLKKPLNYNFNDKILSLECVCAIGLEILDRIEAMHGIGIIHRDIKPSQFMITNNKENVYLIDYGLATHYRVNNKHKEFKTRCKCKGTVSYASINNHLGFRQSRRDDLESLCYSLLYLIKGSLPWKFDHRVEGFRKWKHVLNQKVNICEKDLFGALPVEFSAMLKYTKSIMYDQTPNYAYIKSLLMKFLNYEKIFYYFDWIKPPFKLPKGRMSQIVDGATRITKLRREKKFKVKKSKKRKSLNKIQIACSAGTLDLASTENILKRKTDKNSNLKKNHPGTLAATNGLLNIRSSLLELPKSVKKVKPNSWKHKQTSKLLKNLSALDLDCPESQNSSKTSLTPLSLTGQNSTIQNQNDQQDVLTPRADLPEFKDRKNIFSNRLLQEKVDLSSKKCLIY